MIAHAAVMFDQVVRRHGNRPALRWSPTCSTTFDQLDRTSNQLARVLLREGVRKQDTVGLCLEKGLAAYSAVLACQKIGAPYFFVDQANPPARARAMVEQCRPAVAIATASAEGVFGGALVLTASDEELGGLPCLAGVPDEPVSTPWTIVATDPAYVMFTSGSTGRPKGVTISQGNLAHFIDWTRQQLKTSPEDVFTNLNPLFFDNSIFDIYASLFSGASLVPFTGAVLKRPADVVRRIEQLNCTVFFSVPSLLVYLQTLKLIDERTWPSLRTIMFGGEGYPKPMLAKLHRCLGSRVELLNVYGPTECTCICSAYPIGAADLADPGGYAPLGTLAPAFSHVIVDTDGRLVEDGEVGELLLGGPSVGLGYYGDPEQSNRVFVQNPTHTRYFDRMYRTGDLVREEPRGKKLFFMGRADAQIKHQGYRIELGDIEHALMLIDGVEEAAVVHLTSGGTGRIVAVVGASEELTGAAVRSAVGRLLPSYMIPERVVCVSTLLKNANGKVDRLGIAAAIEGGTL